MVDNSFHEISILIYYRQNTGDKTIEKTSRMIRIRYRIRSTNENRRFTKTRYAMLWNWNLWKYGLNSSLKSWFVELLFYFNRLDTWNICSFRRPKINTTIDFCVILSKCDIQWDCNEIMKLKRQSPRFIKCLDNWRNGKKIRI